MKRSLFLLLFLFPCLAALLACRPATTTQDTRQTGKLADSTALRVEDYYKLSVGDERIYQVKCIGSETRKSSVKILSKEGNSFVDNFKTHYEFDIYGLRNFEKDEQGQPIKQRYLLKHPLQAGTQWLSVVNMNSVERYTILETNQTLQVPAGSYSQCLVIRAREQRAGNGAVEALFYFAHRIGLVKMLSIRELDGKRTTYCTLELVSFLPGSGS